MADKPPAFTVTDRRKFTEDGDLRNPDLHSSVDELNGVAEAAPSPVEAVPAAPDPTPIASAVHPAPGQFSANAVHPAPGQFSANAVHPAPGQFSAAAEAAPAASARVVTMPSPARPAEAAPAPAPVAAEPAAAVPVEMPATEEAEGALGDPTAEESAEQHAAYQETTQQLDELLRQQNPGMKDVGPIGIEHVFQSIYLSAVVAMGAATEPGQKPRIDILGARQSIDMLVALQDKTQGNLTEAQAQLLQNLLFELRMMFLEITNAIAQQAHVPPGRV